MQIGGFNQNSAQVSADFSPSKTAETPQQETEVQSEAVNEETFKPSGGQQPDPSSLNWKNEYQMKFAEGEQTPSTPEGGKTEGTNKATESGKTGESGKPEYKKLDGENDPNAMQEFNSIRSIKDGQTKRTKTSSDTPINETSDLGAGVTQQKTGSTKHFKDTSVKIKTGNDEYGPFKVFTATNRLINETTTTTTVYSPYSSGPQTSQPNTRQEQIGTEVKEFKYYTDEPNKGRVIQLK